MKKTTLLLPVAHEWDGESLRVHLGAEDDAFDAPERSVLVDVRCIDRSAAFGAEYAVDVLDVCGGDVVRAWADEHRDELVDAWLAMRSHRSYRVTMGGEA